MKTRRILLETCILAALAGSGSAQAGLFDDLQRTLDAASGGAAGTRAGSTSNPQQQQIQQMQQMQQIQQMQRMQQRAQPATALGRGATGAQALPREVVYKGYSQQFRPTRELMYSGRLDEAARAYHEKSVALAAPPPAAAETVAPAASNDLFAPAPAAQAPAAAKPGDNEDRLRLLSLLERGTLELDSGSPPQAVEHLEAAQRLLEGRENEGTLVSGFKNLLSRGAETLSGDEELTPYEGEGFERVLMLDYQSLGYLVQGDRRAYNVARRAMDWQNQEEQKFRESLAEVKGKLGEEQGRAAQAGEQGEVEGSVTREYSRFDAKAEKVASAYVNPFGWYIAGLIQEFDSYQDKSEWDNARIAYEKALELNPDSKVIKEAVADLNKRHEPPSGARLLHVVAADGFAPEKKVLVYAFATPQGPVTIQLPIYEPVKSKVARIEVRGGKGEKIATLSPVADIEAIALRHQKDSEPFFQFRALLAVVRTVVQQKALSQVPLGELFGRALQEAAHPDTRSWSSLPSSIQAARVHLKKGMNRVELVSLDERGKVLAREKVELDGDKPAFIYARSVNEAMRVQNASARWLEQM